MSPKAAKLLEDIRDAAAFIQYAATDKTLDDYRGDRLLRQAVERNVEIIGEALKRLTVFDPELAQQIEHVSKIVGFRNVLAHGYDLIDDARVWSTIQEDVPRLVRQVTLLLQRPKTQD